MSPQPTTSQFWRKVDLIDVTTANFIFIRRHETQEPYHGVRGGGRAEAPDEEVLEIEKFHFLALFDGVPAENGMLVVGFGGLGDEGEALLEFGFC